MISKVMSLRGKIIVGVICITGLFISSSFNHITNQGGNSTSRINPPFLDSPDDWADSVYKSLSRDERIAQLFMVRAYSNQGLQHRENVLRLVKKYNIGGLCFFQGGPVRQANLCNIYQQESKTPLLIAIDGEWGLGMRLDSTISYPRQMMLGAIQDDELIYSMGRDIASQMKFLGVHMNLAPVLDVNNNPDNPVINSRSFGEDATNVSKMGTAYIRGLQDGGILCTAKHFPGHGDTDSDSHYTLPVIPHPVKRLRSTELLPFRDAIQQGVTGIMTAHLHVPALDSTPDLASSLSEKIVSGLLKDELGFKGLIVTDALDMQGADGYHKPGDLEALAFKAGNDILLIPSDIPKAISAIKKEIRQGNLSWERVEESCKKILLAKYWAGLHEYAPVETEGLSSSLNSDVYKATLSGLAQESVTLLVNNSDILPLDRLDSLNIACLVIGDTNLSDFQSSVDLYKIADHFNISREASADEFMGLLDELDSYNLVITGIVNTDMRISKKYGISENSVLFINELTSRIPSIISIFANPYSLKRFNPGDELKALLMCYEDNPMSRSASIQAIFGGISAKGILPVSSGLKYKAGDGIITEGGIRLHYGFPEESGIDSRMLYKIDSLCLDAIKEKATPGCQVLASRNGSVFYHKAFGYHSYDRQDSVNNSDIYDVASLTKILATLPALMQLTEQGRFDIESKLSDYISSLDTSDKGDLVIGDILTHHARLAPWIPFYYKTLVPMDVDESLISNKLSSKYPFRLAGHIFLNKNLQYSNGAYDRNYSELYPYKVAEDLFLASNYMDTIFQSIINSELLEKSEYRYSDLGYYLLQQIIENMTGIPLESYVSDVFYKPIGANLTGYLPLDWISPDRIVPTENDLFFRRQLLRGYVHDPGAAMMGGVAGHAGVFSNANDIAKIMQMYLDGGKYGGQVFINDTIINMFNTCIHIEDGNRRGIGFDKPEMDYEKVGPTCQCVSPSSFGHTGFTGTMAWADPESGIIYVFLSNKIHPDQDNTKLVDMNVRTKIQQVIHDAILY
jgi:beta-N-acetylhexosaminidase